MKSTIAFLAALLLGCSALFPFSDDLPKDTGTDESELDMVDDSDIDTPDMDVLDTPSDASDLTEDTEVDEPSGCTQEKVAGVNYFDPPATTTTPQLI
jgi:hypothetical protein